jgi:hypothetical protein
MAFSAAAQFVAVVEIGDGHPALGGVNQGVAMIQPNPVGDRAEAVAGGRILRLRAGIPVEDGY